MIHGKTYDYPQLLDRAWINTNLLDQTHDKLRRLNQNVRSWARQRALAEQIRYIIRVKTIARDFGNVDDENES